MAYEDKDEKQGGKRNDAALLKEIRENYKYALEAWRDTREEGATDMRYVAGDPWSEEDRNKRENAGRPCVAFDELGQYCNRVIGDVRLNKTSVQINPKGYGATAKTAETRQGIVRDLETDSQAQDAYTTAFESMLQRSYGFAGLTLEHERNGSFNQVIRIRRIPNPDTVLFDPDFKKKDASDAEWCFVIDVVRKRDFRRKYPKAKKQSFSAEDMKAAPAWIRHQDVTLAQYWRVEKTTRRLVLVDESANEKLPPPENGQPREVHQVESHFGAVVNGVIAYEDELPEDHDFPIYKDRDEEQRTVTKYITNGVEILDEDEWPGSMIGVVPCFGKEMYLDEGGSSKRVICSLVRLARDPVMAYAFLRSQQMEEFGKSPITAAIGYEGMFEGHMDEWAKANHEPVSVLQVKAVMDATGTAVLPLPRTNPFTPNSQAYEMAADSIRRAIQAAMGISPLPTAAQRNNEKSGAALDRIAQQQAQGSFQFIDNYYVFLAGMGRRINELISKVYDTQRDVAIRKPDDTQAIVRINDPNYTPQNAQAPEHFDTQTGEHEVTVSVGPSSESQREAATDFANTLVSNLSALQLPPELKAKLLALSIRLKQLGPIGDEMVNILDPKDQPQIPQQVQQQMQQAQQQVAALNETCKQYEAKIQELTLEKKAKVLDNEQKLAIEQMKIEAQVAVAEITTKAQKLEERITFVNDIAEKLQAQAHDFAMQSAQHTHEKEQADAAAANAAAAQAADHQAAQEQQQEQPAQP